MIWQKKALAFSIWMLCASSAYALQIVDQAGRKVSVADVPRRIIPLAPSLAECLFALGLDEEIVGVTEYTNFPPQALSKPKVGSYIHLQIEAIVAMKPDLVVATMDGNPKSQIQRLEELGVNVFVTNPKTLEGLYDTLSIMGRILNREARAKELVENMRGAIRKIGDLVGSRPARKVLLQVGSSPLVVAGDETLQNELIRLAGGENIAASQGRGYIPLSIERVVTLGPEIILISSMADSVGAEKVKESWRRWPQIPAVFGGRIHVIDGDLVDRPSPRIVEGLKSMAKLIHPEVAELIGDLDPIFGDRR